MAYTFDSIFAADPSNPANVAASASITIFDPADATKAPITITDPTDSPISNPVTVNKNGFGPAFKHATLDRVGWHGAGFEGFFTSYEGMKEEAVAARNAAETAAVDAAAAAAAGVAPVVAEAEQAAADAAAAQEAAAASATSAANSAALVGAPADNAIATAVEGPGTATRSSLNFVIATQGDAAYEKQTLAGSTWPANGQRAARRRDRGIDAAAEFSIPISADIASSTDAYAAGLSAAVAAVPTGGGDLFLRRGVTRTGTRLFLKQGTVLRGEGVDATTLYITAAAFNANLSDVLVKDMTIYGDNASARQVFHAITTGGAKNWRFENVKFVNIGLKMGRLGATLPDGSILATGCGIDEHIEFDHCEFQGWLEDGMVWSQGVHNVTVNRSRIHDIGTSTAKGDAVKFSYGAKRGRVLHSDFYNLQRDAVDLYDAHSVDVIGNTMKDVAVCAVEAKFESAGPNKTSRFKVHDNTATNCGTSLASNAPVMQLAVPDLSARGNVVDGTPGSGFRVGPASNSSSTRSTDGVWMDNRAYGCAGDGFTLTGTDRHIIRGNVAKSNTGRGYYVPASTNSAPLGGAVDNVSTGNGLSDVWMA